MHQGSDYLHGRESCTVAWRLSALHVVKAEYSMHRYSAVLKRSSGSRMLRSIQRHGNANETVARRNLKIGVGNGHSTHGAHVRKHSID